MAQETDGAGDGGDDADRWSFNVRTWVVDLRPIATEARGNVEALGLKSATCASV